MNIIIFYYFIRICVSESMSNHQLLSNTPITKYCPQDLNNIYRIYEKHPDLPVITMCCATRISPKFMLTEKACLKKFNPIYITVNLILFICLKCSLLYNAISRLKVVTK